MNREPCSIQHALDYAKECLPHIKDGLKVGRLKPHFMYVIHDQSGEVMYVGMASNFYRRIGEHMARSDWWRDDYKPSCFEFPSRRAALDAEKAAIATLNPRFNKTRKAPYKPEGAA